MEKTLKFRTPYAPGDRRYSNTTGNGMRATYHHSIDEEGKTILVRGEDRDQDKEIQLAAKNRSIRDLYDRFVNGDPTALGFDVASYPDLTAAPANLFEAQNLLIKANELFGSLSPQDKQRYNNNVNEFLSAVNNGSFSKDQLTSYIDSVMQSNDAKAAKAAAKEAPPVDAKTIQYIKSQLKES